MKRCSSCDETKPESEFGKDSGRRDGLQIYCRECKRKRERKYYPKAAIRLSARKKRVILRNKELALSYLKAHPCVDCGIGDPILLTFDHVRGRKSDTVGRMIQRDISWERIFAEIEKCEVRCFNCHALKTARERGWRKLEFSTASPAAIDTKPKQNERQIRGRTKRCASCDTTKSVSEFGRNARRLDGLQVYCRECRVLMSRESYRKNPERQLALNRAVKLRNKKKAFDYLLKHPCVDCGLSDPVMLTFDHVNGKKEGAIARMIDSCSSWERIMVEIAKCAVRCFNCHMKKTAREKGWRKLTGSGLSMT